jgi:hypothetical protein
MKNYSLRVICLITVGLIIVACTKSGVTPEMKNSITYNNTEYIINGGEIGRAHV